MSAFSILTSGLILRFCFMSTVSGTSVMTGSSVKREIYVPPDLNAMTPDARKWYLQGVTNANQKLTEFGPIADGLGRGDDVNHLLKAQLNAVLTQVSDANDNTKWLVSNLRYLISSFVSWTRDPSWLDKLKLKATLSYVNGKRDNKSYYLQNGAGLWFKLRLDNYLATITDPNEKTRKLIEDFGRLEDNILLARDTLDDAAQEYVKGIALLVPLVGDIGANEVRIRQVVDKMKADMDGGSDAIINTAADSVNVVKAEIESLKEQDLLTL